MLNMAHFPKASRYWYMGKFYDWSEITLHPMTHGLHYGTSVFEGTRAYLTPKGPAVFRLIDHTDRLFYSAAVAKMTPPYNKNEVNAAIKLLLRENKLESCYIRPLFFYSYGNLGLVPKASPVELMIAAWEWTAYLGDKAANGASVFILPWRRVHHSQLDMKAKLGGMYVQSTIGGLEARSEGCDEAIFLNIEGRVAEGPGQNIFIVKERVVWTNAMSESILQGITRTSILEIAADMGFKTRVAPITKEDFFGADEAFFTGTAVEVIPIVKITDGSDPQASRKTYEVGTGMAGASTIKLRNAYLGIVQGKVGRYEKWLTYVND